MKKRLHVLLTNDDGIHAPGLKHLWRALIDHCDVTIAAPASEKSGVGLGITLYHPLQINAEPWEKNTKAWKITGTPADCVRLSLSVLLDEKPDLIVSGINKGGNFGRSILYSGTIGGAIEGTLRRVPSIAFSCEDFDQPDYESAEKYIYPIVEYLTEHPFTPGTLLNINFPMKTPFKGLRFARQGKGYWIESPAERTHPEGHTYYWLGGKWAHHDEHEDSDVALLKQGYITASPIHVDELTDHALFKERKHHFEDKLSLL